MTNMVFLCLCTYVACLSRLTIGQDVIVNYTIGSTDNVFNSDIIWSYAYDVVIFIPIWISDTVPKTGQSSENMTCADNGINSILELGERVKKLLEKVESVNGVVTHSSGNHGQALAWAAKQCRIKCAVVAPNNSPTVKLEAIKGYGADVVLCEPTPTDRQTTCERVAKEKGFTFIPPYDHYDVIAGQGTIAVEFLDQVPELDAILVPTSGGGMVSGIAIAAKSIKPDIKIFIVEAEGKDVERCLRAGDRLWPNPPRFLNTIADGIRLQQLGHLTWPIILDLVEKDVFTVKNEEMIEGMKFSFQRMKMVVEAASGAGVAAAMSPRLRNMDLNMKNIGVILCGGNVDIDHLPWYE